MAKLFKAKTPKGADEPTYLVAEIDRLTIQIQRDGRNGDIRVWLKHPELEFPGDKSGQGIQWRVKREAVNRPIRKSWRNLDYLLGTRGIKRIA